MSCWTGIPQGHDAPGELGGSSATVVPATATATPTPTPTPIPNPNPTHACRWLATRSRVPPSSKPGGRPEQRVPCITQSGSSSILHVSSSA